MNKYGHKKNNPAASKVRDSHRSYSIDVRDLPEEQVRLVREFAEFLRRKLQAFRHTNTGETSEQDWIAGAAMSFAEDWDNPQDAMYDQWQTHYHVSKR